MMPLFYLVMVATALAGKSLSDQLPPGRSHGWLSAFLLILLATAISRLMMAYAAAHLDMGQTARSIQLARRTRWLLQWGWVLSAPFLLAYCGWGESLREVTLLQYSLTLETMAWLIPSWLFLSATDWTWFEWESYAVAKAEHFAALRHRQLPVRANHPRTFAQFWWNHARHGWLLVSMAALFVCLSVDLMKPWIGSMEPLWGKAILIGLATLIALVALPEWIFWMWHTHPLTTTSSHDALLHLWKKLCGQKAIVLGWKTTMSLSNAMVVGVLPWRRRLLISDLLMNQLNDQELQMVVCHEAAHVRRYHSWLRMMPLAITLALSLGGYAIHPQMFAEASLMNSPWVWGLLAAKIGVGFWLFCRVAHWTELDADRQAVRLAIQAGIFPDDPSGHLLAANTLANSLRRITPANLHRRQTWLYPSIAQRCYRLDSGL